MSAETRVLPLDEHNAALVRNVHPGDWVNPEPAPRYNLVAIGAGTAGLVTAAGAAGLGAKVALVEKHLFGGDCLNTGCVPSKAVIRSARVAAQVRDAGGFGVRVPEGAAVDFASVMERMRRLRTRISGNDSVERFRGLGVDVFLGKAQFTGPETVQVAGKTLRFRKAVIASGSRAFVPPIEGLVEAGFLTNENVFSLTERPEHLAVIGAGPIGCELAQTFRRLGSDVTLIEKSGRIFAKDDPDASALMARVFEREGIRILLNSEVKKVAVSGGRKQLTVAGASGEETVAADEILIGVGRIPNVEGLGLEVVGVEYDARRGVVVNDRLQTTNPRIYAAGDVCLRHKFTHTADAAARIVLQNALFLGRKKVSALTVPWCTYTDPEVAHVGLREADAKARGIEVDGFTVSMDDVDRAICDGEDEGFVKIWVRRGTDRIVGVTIVASHAGDMISEVSVAMAGKVGLKALANVIHPYPTQGEAIKRVGDAFNRTRLTPRIKNLFTRWLAWQRR